jgi:hypothetical protein
VAGVEGMVPSPGTSTGGVSLLQTLQDSAHRLHDIASSTGILRDPRDGLHTKVHRDHQLSSLGNAGHLSLVQARSKLDQLRQLLPVDPWVEALGLCLHQRSLPKC